MTPPRTARPEKTTYYCSACGNEQPRWFGHCPACSEWNTAVEAPPPGAAKAASARKAGAARWVPTADPSRRRGPVPLAEVELAQSSRQLTGLREIDRVLG